MYDTNPDYWVPHKSYASASLHKQYLQSLFWAVEVTTSVGDDIIPKSSTEVGYTVIACLLGLMMYSVILGAATTAFQNMDSMATSRRRILETVNVFLHSRRVPSFLTQIIVSYYEHIWTCPSDGIEELEILISSHQPTSITSKTNIHELFEFYQRFLESILWFKSASTTISLFTVPAYLKDLIFL